MTVPVQSWPASMAETAGAVCQRCRGGVRPFYWLGSPELREPALLCTPCHNEFFDQVAEPGHVDVGRANPDVDYGTRKP